MLRRTRLVGALAFALPLTLSAAAEAQVSRVGHGRNIGVGLAAGYPNVGLALNVFLREQNSLQVDFTWSYRSGYGYFGARADFLFWMDRLASTSYADVRWYFGPGANVGIVSGEYARPDGRHYSGGFFVEAELPVGIALQFSAPLDLALEAVPRLYLVDSVNGPQLGLSVAAAAHLRFYF